MVECSTLDRSAAGLRLTGDTELFVSLGKTLYPLLTGSTQEGRK